MRSAYPIPIKNNLKVMPSIVIATYLMLIAPTILSMYNFVAHERNEKNYHKSNTFEKFMRKRDDMRRFYVEDLKFWQPYKEYLSPSNELKLE